MMGRRARALALALVFATAWSLEARADDAAADWKRRGDEAMEGGRAAEALEAYRRAAAIDPSAALVYNEGRALLAIGDFAGALASFERFDREAPEDLRRRTHRLDEVMAELRGKIALLDVDGEPAGARVRVRGGVAFTLPASGIRTNPGEAKVEIELEGYEPYTEIVELRSGETARVRAVLRRARTTGRLVLATRPLGAAVEVDGAPRGSAPVVIDLAPGPHAVFVQAKGHEPRRLDVEIARGSERRMELELTAERRPLLTRWWFWGIAGVVAAGVTVGVVAASTDRAPESGTLGTFAVP